MATSERIAVPKPISSTIVQCLMLTRRSRNVCVSVQPAKDGTGIMFLVEAAMGTPTLITRDDPQLKKAPNGTDSVIAVGQIDPDPAGDRTVQLDGRDVMVPAGKIALSKTPGAAASTFIQSEHLIYDESQVRTALKHEICFIQLTLQLAPGSWCHFLHFALCSGTLGGAATVLPTRCTRFVCDT